MNRRLLSYAISLSAIAWVGWQLTQHEVWSLDWPRVGGGWLLLVILLMPLNLGLEVAKWHRLNPTTSWNAAAREVLMGAKWAFLTPNRIGDAAGRVASAPAERRAHASRAFVTSAASQLFVTLAMGAWALGTKGGWLLLLGLAFALLAFLLWSPKMPAWLRNRLHSNGEDSLPISRSMRLFILLLSTLRYSIFSTQLFLSFKAVDLRVPVTDIPLIFLGNTVVPSAALGELGVREAVTLAVLSPEGTEVASAVIAAFFVWFINLLVPAMAGIFLKTNPA